MGYVSAVDSNRRTIWIADAHRGDGKHFLVQAEEKLTAFVELELAILKDHPTSVIWANQPNTFRLAFPPMFTALPTSVN